MAIIQQARLSFLYSDTQATLLQNERPAAPMRFIGNQFDYADRFDAIKQNILDYKTRWWRENVGENVELTEAEYNAAVKAQNKAFEEFVRTLTGLTLPWPWREEKYRHHFWQRYLNLENPNVLDGEEAWNYLVPLRSNIRFDVQAAWLPGKLTFDAFFYPHGVALMIMARLQFPADQVRGAIGWTLEQLVTEATRVRRTERYAVTGSGNVYSLDELAAKIMNDLREQMWGDAAPPAAPLEPFTVATIIRGAQIDPNTPLEENSEIHRALPSLCYMDGWYQGNLPPLDTSRLLVRQRRAAVAGSILYAMPNARVVWFPDHIISASGKAQHRLGCYHRNLALLSLQTIMLCHAARLYAERPVPPIVAPQSLLTLSKAAVGKLGLLYGAHADTFKSSSARRYIDDKNLKPMVDNVRRAHRMSGLHYELYP